MKLSLASAFVLTLTSALSVESAGVRGNDPITTDDAEAQCGSSSFGLGSGVGTARNKFLSLITRRGDGEDNAQMDSSRRNGNLVTVAIVSPDDQTRLFGSIVTKSNRMEAPIILTHSRAAQLFKEGKNYQNLRLLGEPSTSLEGIENIIVAPKRNEGHHVLAIVEIGDLKPRSKEAGDTTDKPSTEILSIRMPVEGGTHKITPIQVPFYENNHNSERYGPVPIHVYYEKFWLHEKLGNEDRAAWQIRMREETDEEHARMRDLKLADGAAIIGEGKAWKDTGIHSILLGVVDGNRLTHVGGKIYQLEVIQMSSHDNWEFVRDMSPEVYKAKVRESIGQWNGHGVQPWMVGQIMPATYYGEQIFGALLSMKSGRRTKVYWISRSPLLPTTEAPFMSSLVDPSLNAEITDSVGVESLTYGEFDKPLDFFQDANTKARTISVPEDVDFRVSEGTVVMVLFYKQRGGNYIETKYAFYKMMLRPLFDTRNEYWRMTLLSHWINLDWKVAPGGPIIGKSKLRDDHYELYGIVVKSPTEITSHNVLIINVVEVYTQKIRDMFH